MDLLSFMAHCVAGSPCYATGDTRGNENIVLSALHTIFVREHNRFVDALAAQDPALSDEALFQRGRARVAALQAKIMVEKMQKMQLAMQESKLAPGSPEYELAEKQLLDAKGEFEAFRAATQRKLARRFPFLS